MEDACTVEDGVTNAQTAGTIRENRKDRKNKSKNTKKYSNYKQDSSHMYRNM